MSPAEAYLHNLSAIAEAYPPGEGWSVFVQETAQDQLWPDPLWESLQARRAAGEAFEEAIAAELATAVERTDAD